MRGIDRYLALSVVCGIIVPAFVTVLLVLNKWDRKCSDHKIILSDLHNGEFYLGIFFVESKW